MPSATPLPRGPSALILGRADELLTGPGCPVCRHVAEASERYLAWFALEAHADPAMLARLSASLGMCPPHTRRLMSQPGAATRLTVVYRQVIQAAIGTLDAQRGRPADCPACEHDSAAAERGLDILLDGFGAAGFRERYQELGGLCVPHLRAAAVRRHRGDMSWLADIAFTRLGVTPPGVALLAGRPDQDAEARARLRAALPPAGSGFSGGTCPVCLAAAHADLAQLTQAVAAGGHGARPLPGLCLCAAHLQDAVLAVSGRPHGLLAWQADCQAAGLTALLAGPPRRYRGRPAWRRASGRRLAAEADCPVCRVRSEAARQALDRCRTDLRAAGSGGVAPFQPCVRHARSLLAVDADAGRVAARAVAQRAEALLSELAEAFRKAAWGHRHEARGAEMTAWRRAAVFLDGAVSGACPALPLGDSRPAATRPRATSAGHGGHDI